MSVPCRQALAFSSFLRRSWSAVVEHLELLGMMYEVDESVAKTTNAVLWKVTLLLQVLLTRSLLGTTTGKQQGRRRRSADVVMPVCVGGRGVGAHEQPAGARHGPDHALVPVLLLPGTTYPLRQDAAGMVGAG